MFEYILLDCPPSLGPADGQRAGRRRPGDRAGADRVLRAGGARGAAGDARAGAARAEPAPDGRGDAADDARLAHAAGPRRRARGARALPGPGVRHRDPPQRARGRGAELWVAGHPSRSRTARARRRISSWQGGAAVEALDDSWERPYEQSVAKPKPGMGRGLDAILSVSAEGAEGARGGAARAAGRADRAQPARSRVGASTRRRCRRWRARSASGGCCSRCSCAPSPAAHTSSSPASAAGVPRRSRAWRTIPALVRPRDDAEALELALIENMAREDLNPIEEARACAALVEELGLTREEVGRRVGRSRVAVSNLMRLLDLPDEAIELLEDGRAERGPRHGRCCWPRITARAPGLARAPCRRGGRCGITRSPCAGEQRERRERGTARARRSGARRHASAPRPGAGGAEIADALGAALGAEVRVKPTRDGGYRAEMVLRRLRRRRSSWRAGCGPARWRRSPGGRSLESAPAGD